MKSLNRYVLCLLANCAAAQQTEIANFSFESSGLWTNGLLAWRNDLSNKFCGVEWTENLGHAWQGFGGDVWQIPVTSAEHVVAMPLWGSSPGGLYEGLRSWTSQWPLLGATWQGLFFRVVASPDPLVEPPVTNYLRMINASPVVLSNVCIYGSPAGAFALATNFQLLAVSSSSDDVPVVAPRLCLGEFNWNDIARPSVSSAHKSWMITWQQDGTNRQCGTAVVPVGGGRKTVTVSVYSNRVTTYYEWLGPGGTVAY